MKAEHVGGGYVEGTNSSLDQFGEYIATLEVPRAS